MPPQTNQLQSHPLDIDLDPAEGHTTEATPENHQSDPFDALDGRAGRYAQSILVLLAENSGKHNTGRRGEE